MAGERSAVSKGIAALPILVMAMIHVTVTPLRDMFRVEPLLMYIAYGGALGVGVFLLKRTSQVKDHEYHRSKVMKEMKKVYQAEEEGVWQSNAILGSELSAEAQLKLKGQVGSIDSEAPEMNIGEDDRVDVTMLMDASHIQKANRRMSGDEAFGDQAVDSTIGAVRKSSPMDALLDSIGSLFGRGDAAGQRALRKQARLSAASQADPVTAQRPVAPIRTKSQSNDDTQLRVTSMSDGGGIDSAVTASGEAIETPVEPTEAEKVYAWDQPAGPSPGNSIEDMAMLSTPIRTSAPIAQPVAAKTPICKGCSKPVAIGERFCPHCGLDL